MNENDNSELAAIDLGSNSFHMIITQEQNRQLQTLDKLKESVRLASGLLPDGQLDDEVAERALACLERFGQRIRHLDKLQIRAVGTNTLRKAKQAKGFFKKAQKALGHNIEIISGIEEARLVYLGVSHSLPDPGGQRLVVDIGGGSTELIIGRGFEPIRLESLYMGCVNMTARFFADGKITKKAMRDAITAARVEIQPVKNDYRAIGWTLATGSSGTIKAIRDIVFHQGWSENGITPESLKKLREAIIDTGSIDNLEIEGLSTSRQPVIVGGIAILSAVFDALKVDRMLHSSGALREGVIYDMLGRMHHEDVRKGAINAFAERYHVDQEQSLRVSSTAIQLLKQVADDWQIKIADARQWLQWASLAHEVGLVVAHSGYHKHGAYLIEHSNLAGFSLRDQQFLAILVRTHRRKLKPMLFESLPENMFDTSAYLVTLLRLAVLLHRGRTDEKPVKVIVSGEKQSINLLFPDGWLENNPLTESSLASEKKYLKNIDIKCRYA
ncbi:MAG: exopolyphosphatase [Gammaproteobacteria bacterium]